MSYNKNTVVGPVLTAKPLSLLVLPQPYALVRGNGANDYGGAPYVLCFAVIAGETWADVRIQTEDCDFNDHIVCKQVTAGEPVAYDSMYVDGQDTPEPRETARLVLKQRFFLVKNMRSAKPSTCLFGTRLEAAEYCKGCIEDLPGGDWETVELTVGQVMAALENARFTGL